MTFEQAKEAFADYFGFTTTKPQETQQTTQETVPAWAQSLIDTNKALQERLSALENAATVQSEPQSRGEKTAPQETVANQSVITPAGTQNKTVQNEQTAQPEPQKPLDTVPAWAQSLIDMSSKLQGQFSTLQQQVTQGQAVIGKPLAGEGKPTQASDAECEALWRKMGI
jgi:hypothetical protein